ncbi:hypothetical protein [Parendozoicomonas sp. Alg238-R29]|uniref:hypothetical protein n=1 Tax=Parendozoicomonas sp. Alg238-R29 TaxID=2993446 RepID=UPI00248DF5DE|nr:hypothetical protein [Parendozoicomonas sp. Alg238-R29]
MLSLESDIRGDCEELLSKIINTWIESHPATANLDVFLKVLRSKNVQAISTADKIEKRVGQTSYETNPHYQKAMKTKTLQDDNACLVSEVTRLTQSLEDYKAKEKKQRKIHEREQRESGEKIAQLEAAIANDATVKEQREKIKALSSQVTQSNNENRCLTQTIDALRAQASQQASEAQRSLSHTQNLQDEVKRLTAISDHDYQQRFSKDVEAVRQDGERKYAQLQAQYGEALKQQQRQTAEIAAKDHQITESQERLIAYSKEVTSLKRRREQSGSDPVDTPASKKLCAQIGQYPSVSIPPAARSRAALKSVSTFRREIAVHWRDIAVQLGLGGEASIIESNNHGNADGCMSSVINIWLQREVDASYIKLAEATFDVYAAAGQSKEDADAIYKKILASSSRR